MNSLLRLIYFAIVFGALASFAKGGIFSRNFDWLDFLYIQRNHSDKICEYLREKESFQEAARNA